MLVHQANSSLDVPIRWKTTIRQTHSNFRRNGRYTNDSTLHHVDDIIVSFSPGNPDYAAFAEALQTRYATTGGSTSDTGIPFLNMEINSSGQSIQLSQRSHIRQMLDATLGEGADRSKEDTPLPVNFRPTRLDCPTDDAELRSPKYQALPTHPSTPAA